MTEAENLCVPIAKGWRVVATDAGYALQRRTGMKGWTSVYYTADLQGAVVHAFNVRVRTCGAQSLEELARRIEEIQAELRRDLAPLLNPPDVASHPDEV